MSLTETGREPQAGLSTPGHGGIPPLAGVVWALLVFNTLGSGGQPTIVPIPTSVAQLLTMGALGAAFTLALALNPRLRFRPSALLLLLTLLLVVSLVSSATLGSGLGALLRWARLAVFVATLWLLTPWWDGTLTLVRYHIRVLGAVLLSVLVGLVLAPGLAMPETYDGRLAGVLWWITPTQVGQYGGVVAGLTIVLWLARRASGWSVLGIAGPAIFLLLMSHTRTATTALLAAVTIAGGSLLLTTTRARRALAVAVPCAGLVAVIADEALLSWFRRGQGEDALEKLTGRQNVWDALIAAERSLSEKLFGVGLTDNSFGGLPIDSGWLAVYHDMGLVGVAIVTAFLAVLVVAAVTRPPSPSCACAVFLIVYCLIASYTTVGPGFASTYQLHLVLAAALLAGGGSTATAPTTAARTPG